MRVAVVTTRISNGGAALAASTLGAACAKNMEIKFWSQDHIIDSHESRLMRTVTSLWFSLKRKAVRCLSLIDSSSKGIYKSYSVFNSQIPEQINSWGPDIIHLHWICGEFLSIEDIARLKAPIVWTMHDAWPILASEHHSAEMLNNKRTKIKSLGFGSYISRWVMKRKLKSWSHLDITLICPTEWMLGLAQSSRVSANMEKLIIRNGVDTSIFRMRDDADDYLKKEYGISTDARVILIGSMVGLDDPIKGFDLFVAAINQLWEYRQDFVVAYLGKENRLATRLACRVYSLGILRSIDLSRVYSSSDVTCVPSRIETHSMMAAESLCCGTPVAAFNIAGNPSIVEHKKTGYLARKEDPIDFSRGVDFCLNNLSLDSSNESFATAIRESSLETITLKHQEVYLKIRRRCALTPKM